MIVGSRDESREFFLAVRRKMLDSAPMEPLEALIARIIGDHPEYHAALDDGGAALERDFDGSDGQANPFFHMGLHIALVEQLQTDRPAGIRAVYQRLVSTASGDTHAVEHRMMDCLADVLWQAGRSGTPPDEQAYLDTLRRLAR